MASGYLTRLRELCDVCEGDLVQFPAGRWVGSPKREDPKLVRDEPAREAVKELKGAKCVLKFRDGNQISGEDLVDQNNWPCFFTQSKRGVAKAWVEIQRFFKPESTRMQEVTRFLSDRGIRVHTWCSMD